MSSVSRRFCMLSIRKTLHSNQIYLLQPMPSVSRCFRVLSIRKTLLRIHFFCYAVSRISKAFYLTADQPLLLDNYISTCSSNSFSSPPFRAHRRHRHPAICFGNSIPLLWLNKHYLKTRQIAQSRAHTSRVTTKQDSSGV